MSTEKTISPAAFTGSISVNRMRSILKSRATALLALSLALMLYFHIASNGLFLTSTNASLLLRQTAVFAVVASGAAVLIIMAEIDLSAGSSVFLTGLVAAQMQVAGAGLALSILAAVATGLAIGTLQGLIVVKFAVPAFVVTLAGLLLWRGLGLMWTNAGAVGPVDADFSGLTEGRIPTWLALAILALVGLAMAVTAKRHLTNLKRNGESRRTILMKVAAAAPLLLLLAWISTSKFGLPTAVLWIGAVGAILSFAMTSAKFGRRSFLVGSNREASVYAGISVPRTVLTGFVIMGLVYGVAGIMMTARQSTATADLGLNLELVAIAAAVIGGNSLRGGRGSVWGAVIGAFLLATIDNGMSLLGVSSYAQSVVKGLILIIAVAIDGYFTRRPTSIP